MINLEKNLTSSFKLKEFLRNKWFTKEDEKIADNLYLNNKKIRHNIKILAIQLQILRNVINKPINIHIALRPLEYEIKKGRSGNSRHTKGLAADFSSNGITISELKNNLLDLIKEGKILDGGIGSYNTFIHYDFSLKNKGRRW